ncbi:MAG: RnfABCDGE type electron transport complex subunit D [Patescibacteria group bacterium]|nr:RnfABCDGE type electron transport complex subunit D [Patescibacteria group bacterium]
MLSFIDKLLNKITMYRLVLYYLIILLVIAGIFGAIGWLPYSPFALAFSTGALIVIALITNKIFAEAFKTQTNSESAYITALILALIITPIFWTDLNGIIFLAWTAILAMASKYILAIRKKHLFNPAAFAVALTAFTIGQSASWWVGGNLPLMAFVLAGGFLVVRKIQRFDLVLAFLGAAAVSAAFTANQFDPLGTLQKMALHTPIFFFASIMLTEPLTTPPTRDKRIAYGLFTGFLFAPAIHFGPVYSTPELALLAGNVFSWLFSPKEKYLVRLKEKSEVGKDIYHFTFELPKPIKFRPGQYMEWTLGHEKTDLRGNRRYFTIASSPTEPDLQLGVKFYEPSSSFKQRLRELEPGDEIMAGQLAGDFTLPRDKKTKLAFIAGGIGITPFRSMAKYLSDRGEKRPVVLIYAAQTGDGFAYREIFEEAGQKIGLKAVYAEGRLDPAFIAKQIPDHLERVFYLSGPRSMVVAFEAALHRMGVPRKQIKTDFFPGFA